jgi:polyferredoxin
MLGALGWNIAWHSASEVAVLQVRQPLYVVMADETIRNRYQVHIVNKTEQDQIYSVKVRGIPVSALDLGALSEIKVRAGGSLLVSAKVGLDQHTAKKTHQFEFVVKSQTADEKEIVRKVDFTAPHEHEHENEHD